MSTTRSMITSSSSMQLDEKYFGKTSKKSFVDTYRQLKHHGELLVGGYRALDELISQPMDKNVLAKTVVDLQTAGVLTPRKSLGNPPERPDKDDELIDNIDKKGRKLGLRLVDDDNESGTFLTKVGFCEDDDDIGFEERLDSQEEGIGEKLLTGLDSMSELGGSMSEAPGFPLGMGSLELSMVTSDSTAAMDEEDAATAFSYRTQSPRAIFINGCLKNKIPPITIALVRRNLTSTINLAHMGIGDKIAGILAGCLSSLPYLQVLNLADNNLADSGLSELLVSASKHKEIEELDISNNIIGTAASKALGAFLAHPSCKLRSLRLRDANIDDSECANICGVLKANKCLKELDLSKNLLGKDENLNVVKPEFVTGGESLADLLLLGTCPIEKLVLHWNMIRLDGAIALCNAIHSNKFLTYLDLSYNAIGSAGAEILGKSLLDNSILKSLNVAHNAIDAVGCFTLCIGVGCNDTLLEFILDGNPIGAQGCMALTQTVLTSNPQLTISAQRCDFLIKYDNVKYDATDSAGSYMLDMSIAYERSILVGIMRNVAANPTLAVRSFEVPSDSGKGTESLTVHRETVERTVFSEDDLRDIEELRSMDILNEISYPRVIEICKEYDLEDSDRFDTSSLDTVLEDLGIPYTEQSLIDMKALLDPFQYRYIDIRSFSLYIRNLKEKAKNLLHDLTHKRRALVESSASPGVKVDFIPPHKGFVKIAVVEAFPSEAMAQRVSGMASRKVKRLIDSAHHSTSSLQMLTCGLECVVLHVEEAKMMFTHLFALLDDPVAAVALLVTHMASSYDVNLLIKCCLGYDMKKIRRLHQKLGPIYQTIIGVYSGYYCIDFSNPLSRQCWKHLLARSLEVAQRRVFDGFGELSQHGDGIYCFRNIHIVKPFCSTGGGGGGAGNNGNNGNKQWDISSGTDAERVALLAPLMEVSTIPKVGRIEFDFVNSVVPDFAALSEHVQIHTLSDDSFIRILNACQLLEDQDIDETLNDLLYLMKQARKMMLVTGYQYWTPSLCHAIATGDKLYEMYSNLATRKRSIETISKRESLEIDNSTDPQHLEFKVPIALKSRLITSLKTHRAQKYIAKFISLISNVGRSIRLVSKNTWINRLRNMMVNSQPSAEFRSAHMLEYLVSELVHRWIYCRQLSIVLRLFQFGVVAHSNFGSYRVELIVKLFDRIVDLHNFQFVLMHLNCSEHAALLARIGVLNFFNPRYASGGIQLDLSRWEERQLVKMIIHLSIVESGENFRDEEYAHDRSHVPMPGWELKVTWFQEETLPKKGILSLEMYSGSGMSLEDCQVNRSVRNMLMALVLPRPRDLHEEIVQDMNMTCLLIQDSATAYSSKENRLEYTPNIHLGGMAEITAKNSSFRYTTPAGVTPSNRTVGPTPAGSLSPAAITQQGSRVGTPPVGSDFLSPLESCEASIQTTSDVMLFDPGMQLLYPQLSVFEHYETGADQVQVPATTPKAAGAVKRGSADASSTVVGQPGWVKTGSDSKYMKTYRLEDLHANLRVRTNIHWNYSPLQSSVKPTVSRGVTSKGKL